MFHTYLPPPFVWKFSRPSWYRCTLHTTVNIIIYGHSHPKKKKKKKKTCQFVCCTAQYCQHSWCGLLNCLLFKGPNYSPFLFFSFFFFFLWELRFHTHDNRTAILLRLTHAKDVHAFYCFRPTFIWHFIFYFRLVNSRLHATIAITSSKHTWQKSFFFFLKFNSVYRPLVLWLFLYRPHYFFLGG